MTTDLRLKKSTCCTYIFERLLSYVFNQINNFTAMVLFETDGKKNLRLQDLVAKNQRIWDPKKNKKTRFWDSFKTPPRFWDWNKNFQDPEFSEYHLPPLPEYYGVKLSTKTESIIFSRCTWFFFTVLKVVLAIIPEQVWCQFSL